jgi:hypothetical protein
LNPAEYRGVSTWKAFKKMKKPNANELKLKTGFLQKKSPSFFSGWQERYVKLDQKKLRYFKGADAKYPNGVLNFDHYESKIEIAKKDPCCFII